MVHISGKEVYIMSMSCKKVLAASLCSCFLVAASAWASFTPLSSLRFGGNDFGGNYSDGVKDNGQSYTIGYDVKSADGPAFTVKKGGKIVFRQDLPDLGSGASLDVQRVKDDGSGRIFYILSPANSLEQSAYGYVVGLNPEAGTWQTYVKAQNYYAPLADGARGIMLRKGDLYVYNYDAKSYQAYALTWDDQTGTFQYTDTGIAPLAYFDNALAANAKYRPLTGQAGLATYVDLKSRVDWQKKDTAWVFNVNLYQARANSDIVIPEAISRKYMVNKEEGRAWVADPQTSTWKELPMQSVPSPAQLADAAAVNWCYQQRYGAFLGDLGGDMERIQSFYKGK